MTMRRGYSSLISLSEGGEELPWRWQKHKLQLYGVLLIAILSVVFGVLVGYYILPRDQDDHIPQPLNCDCGTSVSEALKRGCVFDSLSTGWLPAYCRDDELTRQFDAAGPRPDGAWPYWRDQAQTQPVTLAHMSALAEPADIMTGNNIYYSTGEWHVVHCAYYWMKIARMRKRGTMVEDRFEEPMHSAHCLEGFLECPRGLHYNWTRLFSQIGGQSPKGM